MAAATTTTTTSTVRLKLLIDRKGRVVCAEAGKDFVDFLFNILLLPIGTVIRLLTKEAMVGCLGNLYRSVENLADAYILPTTDRESLLKPKCPPNISTNVPLLLPNVQHQTPTPQVLYRCRYGFSADCSYHTNDPTMKCPNPECTGFMTSRTTLVKPAEKASASSSDATECGFVRGAVTYTIMDDLTVTLMSTTSTLAMLREFNVKQVDALEEKVVHVGMDEGVEFLKVSLQSKTVLIDVFLSPKQTVKLDDEESESSDDGSKSRLSGGRKK
ncbi:hypothetical protein V6N13_121818 [Hibiscus sabdariffa]|uniref:DUF674 domain-containing protein n=2 Tax=Hibiscus sabdariffa TaxID=183260 RepID=A0ABR1ZKN4_9ROSI